MDILKEHKISRNSSQEIWVNSMGDEVRTVACCSHSTRSRDLEITASLNASCFELRSLNSGLKNNTRSTYCLFTITCYWWIWIPVLQPSAISDGGRQLDKPDEIILVDRWRLIAVVTQTFCCWKVWVWTLDVMDHVYRRGVLLRARL